MTAKNVKKKKHSFYRLFDPTGAALGILGLFSLLLLFKNPAVALECTSGALSLCVKIIIPSLFPFMVISELLLSSGSVALIAPFFRRPSKFLFGVGGESAVALILGFLCGFPIGAKCAAALYKSGRIGKVELTRVLTFSCMPSAPFLISAVGISMFGSGRLGLLLFAASLLSSLIIGAVGKYVPYKSNESAPIPLGEIREEKRSAAVIFTSAVTSSALSMLYICAFVVFFSAFVGILEYSVRALELHEALDPLLFGFFELTSGIRKASDIPLTGQYLAAAIAGWSGLSVHFQVMSVCRGCDISFKPYFLAKLASAVLNPVLLFCFYAVG